MSDTPMLDNIHAAFDGPGASPLYGLPYNEDASGVTIGTHKVWGEIVPAPYPRTAQFVDAVAVGCNYAIINAASTTLGALMETITVAHGYGLAVIVKNPMLCAGPLQAMSHSNTAGILVEYGSGMPAQHDAIRRSARKDGLLPMWFVFDPNQEFTATVAADEISRGGLTGMEVVLRS